jgi:hypothetical protein
MVSSRFINCETAKKEVSKRVGPHDRARLQINQELKIETDCMRTGGQIQGKKKLIVKQATRTKWCDCLSEVMVVKDDLSHRLDVFCIPHTEQMLLSDLEVFELLDDNKSGLIICVATYERETMVAYVVSPRQCGEIGHNSWKKHLDSLKKAEIVKPNAKRPPTKKPVIFNIYNCYGKRKDPFSCKVSDYAYRPMTSEHRMNECNSGLRDLLSDMEYLSLRGLRSLSSSDQFKHVQDRYQLPTDFDSTDDYVTSTAFTVRCHYWSAIHVDYDYYYTSLSCVSEKVNDRKILFYFCFPTYGMGVPMYSGSLISFNRHLPHGCTCPMHIVTVK